MAARAAFCILFCVTPFTSMNGMKTVHMTKKARATTGTLFTGKYLRCTAKPALPPATPAAAPASELYRSNSPRREACARALYQAGVCADVSASPGICTGERMAHRSFSSSRRSSQRCPASRDKLAPGETSASLPVEDSLDIEAISCVCANVAGRSCSVS